MTASVTAAGFEKSPAGLVDLLHEALRPEFCRDVLVFPASDPVFGGGACLAGGCDRSARGLGLCPGHYQRWKDAGRPPVESFCATTDPRWRRQQPNASCSIADCGYGVVRSGLCSGHFQRWDRSGRPDLETWRAGAPAVRPPARGARCRIVHCELWPHGASELCRSHQATWRANGRPDIDEFVLGFEPRTVTAAETIELQSLTAQLKLEIQYALQSRRDDRAGKIAPAVVRRTVAFLAATTVRSLLDRTESQWRTHARHKCPKDAAVGRLVAYAHRKLSDLADAQGWEAEFPRDVWLLRRLGRPGNETLSFEQICQPWLRDLVKRWVRGRLSAELNLETVRRGLRSLSRFSGFCARVGVDSLAEVDRCTLERYLADLHAEWAGRHSATTTTSDS